MPAIFQTPETVLRVINFDDDCSVLTFISRITGPEVCNILLDCLFTRLTDSRPSKLEGWYPNIKRQIVFYVNTGTPLLWPRLRKELVATQRELLSSFLSPEVGKLLKTPPCQAASLDSSIEPGVFWPSDEDHTMCPSLSDFFRGKL